MNIEHRTSNIEHLNEKKGLYPLSGIDENIFVSVHGVVELVEIPNNKQQTNFNEHKFKTPNQHMNLEERT